MKEYSFLLPNDEYIPDGEELDGYWDKETEENFWECIYLEPLEDEKTDHCWIQ